jgi:hypothetical protein
MAARAFVAYLRTTNEALQIRLSPRVSQREAVERYVGAVGGRLVKVFEEGEPAQDDFAHLAAALDYCRSDRAVLVVGRLDHGVTDGRLIARLLESNVDFIAADWMMGNRLAIHMVAEIIEGDGELGADRLERVLRVALARKAKVGNTHAREVQPLAVAAARTVADQFALRMAPVLAEHEADGRLSLKRLAAILELCGYPTPRGSKRWSATTVFNLKKRIARLNGRGDGNR